MDVLMPQLGETVTEGTISAWYKNQGETVEAGENLFEVETDKVSMEVQALQGGVLKEIRVRTGECVPVGTTVAVIESGDDAGAATAAPDRSARPPTGATAPAGFGPFSEVATPTATYGGRGAPEELKITPLARRLAAQAGVDLGALARTVKEAGGWRIAKSDVVTFAARAAAAPPSVREARPYTRPADSEVVPMNRIRRSTADRLAHAWATVPHVVQAVEVDFHRLDRARRALNERHAARWGFRLTFLPCIARAVCLAIRDFPHLNASVDGANLVVHKRLNLGIAVDLGHDGLVVPVVHGAQALDLAALAGAIDEKVRRAQAGALDPSDLSGGTYTLSNSGTFGTLFTAPIVNPPEVAILSTDGVRKRPVVREGEDGDQIVIHPVGVLAQSFDHRAVDGAYSAAYLQRLREIIETRDWMAEVP